MSRRVDRLATTYQYQLCTDIRCSLEDRPGAMDNSDGWQVRELRAVSATWWWWWWWSLQLRWWIIKSLVFSSSSHADSTEFPPSLSLSLFSSVPIIHRTGRFSLLNELEMKYHDTGNGWTFVSITVWKTPSMPS